MSDPVIAVYVNPVDILRANAMGYPKVIHPKVPKGVYFVLLKGGRYGA